MQLKGKHVLTLGDFDTESILNMLDVAKNLKSDMKTRRLQPFMQGRTLATIFEKPSLRTRISFDVGFMAMGGNVINIRKEEINLGVREPIKDCARNISRYVDCIMIRTFAHSNIEEFAKYATVPVINGLTDKYHPCQIMADLLTVQEKYQQLKGLKMTYIGDGNNVANSLLLGCSLVGMDITVAAPGGYSPTKDVLDKAQSFASKMGSKITVSQDPKEAVKGANVIYTDVWASMGQEKEAEERMKIFKNYQVNIDVLKQADPNCIVMHCLPAHRDQEITDEVFELHADTIFDQAENRMHAQNAVMACVIG
ncbi:MAG: ornithine carbamoyltransferase [Vampirovibrionia bacterium]